MDAFWREMAVSVSSLGMSASVVLTYSAEVMVGKVVLMQPRLNSEQHNTTQHNAPAACRLCKPGMSLLTELNETTQP